MDGSRPRRSQEDYLAEVGRLAHVVVQKSLEEGWLTYLPEDGEETPLRRSINELARNLRHVHDENDGCLEGFEE